MERLDLVGDSSPYFNIHKKEEKKKSKKSSKAPLFSSLLNEASETEDREEVGNLMALSEHLDVAPEKALDEIHDIGEKLKKNPTLALVKEYRQAVGTFVRYVIRKGLLLDKQKLKGFKVLKLRPGEQPELTVVRIVDKKLNELAHQVLKNQKEQMEILKRIDEIHGILVDLFT
jgi:uncharacterized protein YaaR (DUF327 family)